MFWKIRRPRFGTSWGGAQVAKLCLSYCLAGYGRGSPLVFTAWASGRDLGRCCFRTVPGPKSFFSWRSAVTLQAWAILLIPALINYSYSFGESIHCLVSQELRLSTYLWLAWLRGTYKIWLSCWQPYAVPFDLKGEDRRHQGISPLYFSCAYETHIYEILRLELFALSYSGVELCSVDSVVLTCAGVRCESVVG